VETNNERRLRKLKLLCSTHGLANVAGKAGLKPVYLEQIIKGVKLPPKKEDGSRSERALGDSAARAIEEAYQLGRGWFDNDEEEATMSPKELELLGLFRQLNDEVTQGLIVEGVRDALADRARQHEGIRKRLAQPIGGNFVGSRASGFGALDAATKTRTRKK
jgi:hypothetical protein